MKLIEEIKYQWWKRNQIKQELKSVYRQLNEWEATKLKEEDREFRDKYEAIKNPVNMVRKPEEIYQDIVRVCNSSVKKVVIVLEEFNDNGKILEKTIEFRVPVSDELVKDFNAWLDTHKDQKYKIRLEDYNE